jgi:regulator of protease activity HflC (stomatin/prohibitin superfamily)
MGFPHLDLCSLTGLETKLEKLCSGTEGRFKMKIHKTTLWYSIVSVVLLVADIIFISMKISFDSANIWNLGWTILSLQIVHAILSLRIVDPKTKGVVVVLGDPKYPVNSGLVLVPFGIAWLEKMPGTIIQIQIPAEPEKIDRSNDDKKTLAPGMFWPIRVTTGFEEVAIKNFPDHTDLIKADPLRKRMTIEVTGYTRIRISDPVNFLRNIGSEERLREQVRDTFESTIRVEFGRRTPGLILTHLREINGAIQATLRRTFNRPDWGLSVESAQLVEKDLTHTLNTALRDASTTDIKLTQAETDKRIVVIKSEGDKIKLINDGEGNAAAEKSMLLARAEGLLKMAEVAKTTEGAEMMRLQLLIEALKSSEHTIITSGGIGGLTAELTEISKRLGANATGGVK